MAESGLFGLRRVSKRHFTDADCILRYFELDDSSSNSGAGAGNAGAANGMSGSSCGLST
jgi:hypothetical protein